MSCCLCVNEDDICWEVRLGDEEEEEALALHELSLMMFGLDLLQRLLLLPGSPPTKHQNTLSSEAE